MVTIDEFKQLDLRIAQIKEIKEHPNADKLYVVHVDIGGEIKQLVAGIRTAYPKEALVGKKVVVICNLQPATIRGEESNGMILAASDEHGLAVLTVDKDVAVGSKVR